MIDNNYGTSGYKVRFDMDYADGIKEYWSVFTEHELTVIDNDE